MSPPPTTLLLAGHDENRLVGAALTGSAQRHRLRLRVRVRIVSTQATSQALRRGVQVVMAGAQYPPGATTPATTFTVIATDYGWLVPYR